MEGLLDGGGDDGLEVLGLVGAADAAAGGEAEALRGEALAVQLQAAAGLAAALLAARGQHGRRGERVLDVLGWGNGRPSIVGIWRVIK